MKCESEEFQFFIQRVAEKATIKTKDQFDLKIIKQNVYQDLYEKQK